MPPNAKRSRKRRLGRVTRIKDLAKRASKTAAEYAPYCTAAIQTALGSSTTVSLTLIAFSVVIKAVADKQEQAKAGGRRKAKKQKPKAKKQTQPRRKKRQIQKQRQTRTKPRASPRRVARSPLCGRPKVDGTPCQNPVKGGGPCHKHGG